MRLSEGTKQNHIKTVGTAFEEKIDVLGRWNSCSRPREEKRQPTHPSVVMKRQLLRSPVPGWAQKCVCEALVSFVESASV